MVRNFIYPCLLLLGILYCPTIRSQPSMHAVDSLLTALNISKPDTAKVTLLIELGWEYMQLRDDTTALEYLNQALALGRPLKFNPGIARALRYMAANYNEMGRPADAAICAKEAIAIYEEIGSKKEITKALIVLGESEAQRGNMVDAEEYLLSSLRLAEETGDTEIIQNSTQYLAKFYRLTKQFEESITYHQKSLQLAKELRNPKNLGNVYYSLAALYTTLGKNNEALEACTSAMENYKVTGTIDNLALTYNMMGLIYQRLGTYPEALHYFQLYLKLKETTGDHKGIGLAYRNMANTYVAMNMHEEAMQVSQKKLNLMIQNRDTVGITNTYDDIGFMYLNTGDYVKALQYYLAAVELANQASFPYDIASTYNNIGHVYFRQGNYAVALDYYKAALPIREKSWNKHALAITYYNLCDAYINMDSLDQALVVGEKSMEIMEKTGSPVDIARVSNLLGIVYMKLGQYAKSKMYLESALETSEKTDPKECEYIYVNMGDLLLHMADEASSPSSNNLTGQAKSYFEKAYSTAHASKNPDVIIEAYRGISEVYKREGAYLNALEYLTKYTSLKDSLLNNETTRQLEQLRTQYEVEKAVTAQKAEKDSLLAVQKYQTEKELAERNARHQLEIAEAKAQEEKAVEAAKYRYFLQLANAKTEQEKRLAKQQYENDLRIAEESARHRIELAEEKAKQEKKEAALAEEHKREKAERERRTEMALAGGGMLGLFSILLILYQRQRSLKQKAIERADTIHKMTELELQSLRAQLNPHFMFNSLNAIQELILMEENDKSHTYLARFAKLLRMLLENANSPFIPVARELEFLELYLSLEKLRIPDLKYHIQIDPEINKEETKIPNMILQPYIENAIWHGLSPKPGEKKLSIHISRQNGTIQYVIEDNGVGRQKAAEMKSLYRKEHKSRGMELLTKRFKLLSKEFGSDIKTDVTDVLKENEVRGTKVFISVPVILGQREPTKQIKAS